MAVAKATHRTKPHTAGTLVEDQSVSFCGGRLGKVQFPWQAGRGGRVGVGVGVSGTGPERRLVQWQLQLLNSNSLPGLDPLTQVHRFALSGTMRFRWH